MRTRLVGTLLLLLTFTFLSTSCTTNKVVSSSNIKEQTDMSSSVRNTPAKITDFKDSEIIKTASFIDLNNGWIAIGQGIFHTEDGGLHWTKIADNKADIYNMDFLSLELGWLATSDGLLKSQDGGRTWSNVGRLQNRTVTEVQFVNKMDGWIYCPSPLDGNCELTNNFMRTTDGGMNWTNIDIPDPNFGCTLAYSFISPDLGWLLVGSQGGAGNQAKRLYKTQDGGKGWNEITRCEIQNEQVGGLSSGGYVSDLFFLNENYGWLTEARGDIEITTDGGKHWGRYDGRPMNERFMSKPFFIDPKEGYVLDNFSGTSLLKTIDGGLSWKLVINGKLEELKSNGQIDDPELLAGNHHFDRADCVYLDKYWNDTKTGQFGSRYVISFEQRVNDGVATNTNQQIIQIYNENRLPDEDGKAWVNYICPKDIGEITYMHIEYNQDFVVQFDSAKGKGTLNLKTYQWSF